ncbi:MAG: hypothetical protein VX265_17950, partial [Myxococcota bacterium]|nr:hypothetical protein [Myxococcota bacterium]MEC8424574.1 hypothetical protein [Myxococcota bacterium]
MHSVAMFIFAMTAGPLGCHRYAAAPARPSAPTLAGTRRPFSPTRDGNPVMAGISYGPFRTGQRPGGPHPTPGQIRQDLDLLASTWALVRVYSSQQPTETILQVLRDHQIPIQVVIGAWIAGDSEEGAAAANRAEVDEA